jgi:hypothetical protein
MLSVIAQFGLDVFDPSEQLPGAQFQGPTCFGHDDLSGLTIEQWAAQLLLEPQDGPTQGRLGHSDILGGPGEIAPTHHTQEMSQLIELHLFAP